MGAFPVMYPSYDSVVISKNILSQDTNMTFLVQGQGGNMSCMQHLRFTKIDLMKCANI